MPINSFARHTDDPGDMHSPLPGPVAGFLRFSEIFGKYFAWRGFPTSTGPKIYKKLEKARAPRLVRAGSFSPETPIPGAQHLGRRSGNM